MIDINTAPENPRAVIGSNTEVDHAKNVIDQLKSDYAQLALTAEGIIAEADLLPVEIVDDTVKGVYTHLIKRIRDVIARVEAFQKKEKEPYLRGGQAVDQFFFGIRDRLGRRVKTSNPGVIDTLNSRLTKYDNHVLEQKRIQRQREADEAARTAEEARKKAEAAQRAEAEKRAEAERARAPHKIEEKREAQATAAIQTDAAMVDALVATDIAERAAVATAAKPADLMRTRNEDTGTLSTMTTEKYADVIDVTQLPADLLWPHVPYDAKVKAVRAFAIATNYSTPLPGASIGKRQKSVVR